SLGGAAVGLLSYLQAGAPALHEFINSYYEQWRYRAGLTDTFSWTAWWLRQIGHPSANYSIPLALISLGTLVAAASKRILWADSQVWRASIYAFAVLIGQVAYMLVAPQASGIHIYFQYFLSIPIAFGAVFVVDLISEQFIQEYRANAWLVL